MVETSPIELRFPPDGANNIAAGSFLHYLQQQVLGDLCTLGRNLIGTRGLLINPAAAVYFKKQHLLKKERNLLTAKLVHVQS